LRWEDCHKTDVKEWDKNVEDSTIYKELATVDRERRQSKSRKEKRPKRPTKKETVSNITTDDRDASRQKATYN